MIENPDAQVMRLADFLGCSFTEEEKQSGMVEKILELCSFGNLSNLEANKTGTSTCGIPHHGFFVKEELVAGIIISLMIWQENSMRWLKRN